MNLHDLDFSRRLPSNFHQNVQIPIFPKLRQNKSKSVTRGESLNAIPKTKTMITSNYFKKYPTTEAKFSAWTEIRLPFSKTLHARSYHSAVFYEDSIFIYGGYEISEGVMCDFVKLNYSSKNENDMQWESMPVAGLSPGKLCRHNACIYNKRMYVFGGKKNVSNNSNDIFFYDFEYCLWIKIFIGSNDIKPKKVDSFSLNLDLTHETIIVFGGFYGKFTNNLFFFHLNENRWEKIVVKGPSPDKRAGHCAIIYKDNSLIVSGGGDFERKFNDLWILNLNELIWLEIDTNERVYKPGIGHSMVSFEDNLVIFGGIGGLIHEKNDVVLHDLKKKSWKKISLEKDDELDIIDFKQNAIKVKKKNTSRNQNSFLTRSNTKATGALLNHSLASSFQRRNSTKPMLDGVSFNKNSFEKNLFGLDLIKEKNIFHENIEQKSTKIKTHSKTRSPKSLEKSKVLNISASLLKKTIRDLSIMNYEKIKETKKRILLNQFEIFDEKLKKELLNITPRTEVMKTTVVMFQRPIIDDNNNRKIIASSYEFLKKKENTSKIIGNVPCPRDGHSALVINNKMIIIGGDRHQRQYHDVYECNLKQLLKNF